MKHIYFLIFLFLAPLFAAAQTHSVQGSISTPDGYALPGAVISVQGGSQRTTSDVGGMWYIPNVRPADVLLFSYSGYPSKQITVGKISFVEVKLGDEPAPVGRDVARNVSTATPVSAPVATPVPVAEAVPVGRDAAGHVSTAPTAGLVAYYPFNGSAKDESGNGNNPTTLTDVTLTSDRFGNANSAYSFNGSSSRMVVPNSSSLNITGTGITISFWMLWRNKGGNYVGISKGGCDVHNGYELSIRNEHPWGIAGDMGGGGFTVFTSGEYSTGNYHTCGREFNTLKYRGQWCHFVATFSNGQITEYVNGVKDFSKSLRGSNILGSSHNLHIGARDPANNWAGILDGYIDDIRIYNRALSSDEVNQLYNEK